MVHGAVRVLFHVLGGFALLILLCLGLTAWRLSQGPISLSALTPSMEDAVNVDGAPLRLRLGDVLVAWSGGDHPLALQVTGVRAEDSNGTLVASLPEAAVEVSPRWLIRGQLRLRSLDIVRPHLKLVRGSDGAVNLGLFAQPKADPASLTPEPDQRGNDMLGILLAALAGDTEKAGPLAELRRVRLVDADAEIEDRQLGVTWHVPQASADLQREGQAGIALTASMAVDITPLAGHPDPDPLRLDLQGHYVAATQSLTLDLSMAGIEPNEFAEVLPQLAPLAGIDLPLGGTLSAALTITPQHLRLDRLTATLIADHGQVHLPAETGVGADYTIKGLELAAHAEAQPGQNLLDMADHPAALRELALSKLNILLTPPQGTGTSRVSVTAHLRPADAGGLQGQVIAETEAVPVAALAAWWPQVVAPNPRDWVITHLRDGIAEKGRWNLSLKGADLASLEPVHLKGLLHATGMTVDYLPPMPAVRDGVADVAFALDKLDITVHSGAVPLPGQEPLQVQKGTVLMTGLDAPEQMTDISLQIDGALPAALMVIDSPPLGYASKLGLKPSQARGKAETTLQMRFPPLADLKLDQIDVKAHGKLSGVSLTGAVFGQDLTDGDLTLDVDTKALNAKGQAGIGGVPASFVWKEVFSGRPYRSRYKVHAVVEEDKRGIFGLTFPPFTPRYISGPATADIDLTIVNSTLSTLQADVDLKNAGLNIPGLDWHKAAGTPAQASVAVRMAGSSVREVPSFKVTSGDRLALEGRVDLDEKSGLQRLDINRARIDASDFAGSLTRQDDGGYLVDLHGSAFDLVPFMRRKPAATAAAGTPASKPEPETLPPLTIKARFDTVWMAEDGTLDLIDAQARRVDGVWRWAEVSGQVEGNDSFQYSLTPRTNRGPLPDKRSFKVESSNAGGLLRSLGMLGTMQGGTLKASGTVTPEGISTGTLEINDYRLVNAPILARVLSVAALTGILDSLRGEGIGFDHLTAPFTLSDDLLLLRDFQTSGAALGITGSGRVDLTRDEVDVGGTVVPAYAVNSLVGKIPLLGGLLSGFTEGGGLIAATYSVRGKIEEPDISVNALSALAPGFLKTLFGMGEPDKPVPE
ncbi:YhdP family protein [Insolitispirillum peregrinum]|uniref:YhdP family protein n=1 Tax=Insolitispirillum peregrinum TaxID=80876 RepID=UPI0036166C84